MKEPKKTYVGAAVFFERLADDGWPEDAGWWPERTGGCTVRAAQRADDPAQEVRRLSLSSFLKPILRGRKSE
jgi:hypothetical protein